MKNIAHRVMNAYKVRGIRGIARAIAGRLGFDTTDRHSVNEVEICAVALQFRSRQGVMIDVGAHFGHSAHQFCKAEWKVYAFEPDSDNREQLVTNLGKFANLVIDPRALSNEEDESVVFYQSPQSTGISGLSSFHESHTAAGTVSVTTLEKAINEYGIESIDFLKIDTEGYDKFVLMGLPWETHAPETIVCEFEDFKTKPLGYDFNDLVRYLEERGYQVMVSEWEPIVAYGKEHTWSDFKQSPCKLSSERSWGNLIASRDPQVFRRIVDECDRIKRRLT